MSTEDVPASIDRGALAAMCRDTLIAFAHHLDHRRFEEAAELFAADGVWSRHGELLQGRSRILEIMSARPATQVERHVVTTIDVEIVSPSTARAVSYVTIYRATSDLQTMIPVPGPQHLVEFHDDLIHTVDGWRIASRSAIGIFSFGASA